MAVTGLHRKAAIRLLPARRGPGRPPGRAAARGVRRGHRPRRRGPVAGERADRRPSAPPLRARTPRPPRAGRRVESRPPRRQAGPPGHRATLARLLAPARATFPRRPTTITRPGGWLREAIPIRTFTEWGDARPGFCEVDLVAHGGSSTEGFYLCTLCAVDIATTWVELEAGWGKTQQRVGGAIHHVWERLPVPLVGLDRDNGSEFLNHSLYDWCRRHAITPAADRGRRTRVLTSSRKPARSCASSWAMIGSPPRRPMLNSLASTTRAPARELLPAGRKTREKRRGRPHLARLRPRADTLPAAVRSGRPVRREASRAGDALSQSPSPPVRRDLEAALDRL